MKELPSSLSGFIDEVLPSNKTVLVINRTGPEPLIDLLSKAFNNQSVTVSEKHIPERIDDLVCLVDDGEVVATSPLKRLKKAFLLVNADRYQTGTGPVEYDQFPDVLTGLTETEFGVAGYPVSNKEKLILIVISRFIEYLALTTGHGRIDSTFQRLSRLDDEYGTRTMYERISESDVETHLYGVQDDPDVISELDVHVHSGNTAAYRRSWVVVFTPDESSDVIDTDPTSAALVAVETGPNVWRGIWTYDSTRVKRIQSYVKQEF